MTLAQSSSDSAINATLTLTATVTWSGGTSPEPDGGWYVEFTGTADEGWSSGPVATDDGVATYARTTPLAQTETITAQLVTPGCTAASLPVTHEWWEPEITLNEENADSAVGTNFELTGFVTRGADPEANAAVSVGVYNLSSSVDTQFLSTVTDNAGTFSVNWDGASPSIEQVDVTASNQGGFAASTVTGHSWSGPAGTVQDLTLLADAEARVADRVVATAQIQPASASAGINFLTNLNPPWRESNVPPPAGTARYSYAGNDPAGWGILGARSSEAGLHRARAAYWWQPVITFVAPGSQSAAGEPYPATVVVTDRGRPVSRMRLSFTLAGDELAYGFATTNANGVARAPISGAAGDDRTIDVVEVSDDETPLPPLHRPAAGSTTHTWLAVPQMV